MINDARTIASSVLGRNVPVRFLVPEGSNLKCLFLLHGYGGDHDHWCDNSPIVQLAQTHQLAVVMPACGNGYYEDTTEDMPRFLGEELLSYAKANLPISDAAEDIYIAGMSMGGFGALLIGAKYPHAFGKIASLSGAFVIADVVIGNPGVLGNADPNYFKRIFGSLDQLEGSSRDPLAVAIRALAQGHLPPVYLLCGTEDVLHAGNRKLANALRDHGARILWQDGPGAHGWEFGNRMLPDLIHWLAEDTTPAHTQQKGEPPCTQPPISGPR